MHSAIENVLIRTFTYPNSPDSWSRSGHSEGPLYYSCVAFSEGGAISMSQVIVVQWHGETEWGTGTREAF